MRALVLLAPGLLLVAAGLVVRPEPAAACSCAAEPTPEVAIGRAEAVFAGHLVEITPPLISTSSAASQTLRFTVDRVYKGEVGRVVEVRTAQSSASCGLEIAGLGPYVIFGSGTGTSFHADLCGGSIAGTAPASLGAGRAPTAAEVPEPSVPMSPALWWVAGAAAAVGALVLVHWRRSRRR